MRRSAEALTAEVRCPCGRNFEAGASPLRAVDRYGHPFRASRKSCGILLESRDLPVPPSPPRHEPETQRGLTPALRAGNSVPIRAKLENRYFFCATVFTGAPPPTFDGWLPLTEGEAVSLPARANSFTGLTASRKLT